MPLPDLSDILAVDVSRISELKAQAPHDGSLFDRLFAIFREEGPNLIEELKGSLANGDLSEAHEAIHKIKGSSASMGASRIFALASFSVEVCRSGGAISELSQVPDALEREYSDYLAEAGQFTGRGALNLG